MRRMLYLTLALLVGCGQGSLPSVEQRSEGESKKPDSSPPLSPVRIRERSPELLFVHPTPIRHKQWEWVECGDVSIRVKETKLLLPGVFWIGLQIHNPSETRKFDFSSWVGREASLRDEFDNIYTVYRNHVPALNGYLSVHPGEKYFCVIQAELPIQKAKTFYLRLDGANVYSETDLEFELKREHFDKDQP